VNLHLSEAGEKRELNKNITVPELSKREVVEKHYIYRGVYNQDFQSICTADSEHYSKARIKVEPELELDRQDLNHQAENESGRNLPLRCLATLSR